MRESMRPVAAVLIAALTAGCAERTEVAPGAAPGAAAGGAEEPAGFEVSPAGAVGIGIIAAVVVLALLVAQDDAVSFD